MHPLRHLWLAIKVYDGFRLDDQFLLVRLERTRICIREDGQSHWELVYIRCANIATQSIFGPVAIEPFSSRSTIHESRK